MRAVVVPAPGGPEVLQLVELPDPEPGPGEILVRVTAAGVNRADLLQRQGRYPPPAGASELLGLECSGQVAALGEGVEGWGVGDPCAALLAGGGYAELVVAPVGQVVPPPPRMSLVTAGGVMEAAATVWSNFAVAGLSDADLVLVHGGAGGIGSFAIPYGRSLGARIATTAGTVAKRSYCEELGAIAFDYHDDWLSGVLEWSGGSGVGVVLDVMGGSYLEQNVRALATGGRLMIIGLQGGRKGTLDIAALLAKQGRVHATALRPRPVEEKAAICAAVVEQVWPRYDQRGGGIAPPQVEVFPLAEAAAAHRWLESGTGMGKAVLATG